MTQFLDKFHNSTEPEKTGVFAFLGNTAGIPSKTFQIPAKTRRYADNLKLLAKAQSLLTRSDLRGKRSGSRHRTRLCHAASSRHGQANIRLSTDESNSMASYGSVQTCGSVWACPVCSARIAAQRANEIESVNAWAFDNGLLPVMVTLTAQHSEDMGLAGFKAMFKRAWQLFSYGGSWQKIRKAYGCAGIIKGVEILRSQFNGWHYHYHLLMYLDKRAINDDFTTLTRSHWLKCLGKAGLSGIGEIACHVSADQQVGKHYLAKMGLSDDDRSKLNYEISGARNKENKGASQFDLLARARAGDDRAGADYVEFVRQMDGENWITFSQGLKALAGLDDVEDETIAATDDNEMLHWLAIPEHIAAIKRAQLLGDVLLLAARTRDADLVMDFIVSISASAELSPDIKKQVSMLRDKIARYAANLEFAKYRVKSPEIQKREIAAYKALISDTQSEIDRLIELRL